MTEPTNLENAIENPMNFYYGASTSDWYSGKTTNYNDYLWADASNNKTPYDPCPYGWRVPHNQGSTIPWAEISSGTKMESTYGIIFSGIGYWQAAGQRSNSNGANYVWSTNTSYSYMGFFWGAAPNGNEARKFEFYSNGNLSTWQTGMRDLGFSIRCVKDN